MVDGDASSFFLGDEASFQKKEADLAKKLVSSKCPSSCLFSRRRL